MSCWEDVVIGCGDKGNSAYRIHEIKGNKNISENSVCYWIHNVYLGLGMTIFKDTKEGQTITGMIAEGQSLTTINGYIEWLLLKNSSPEKLKMAIDNAIRESFIEGQKVRSAEFRELLGV